MEVIEIEIEIEKEGEWRARLKPCKAGYRPQEYACSAKQTIGEKTAEKDAIDQVCFKITLRNIIASGQYLSSDIADCICQFQVASSHTRASCKRKNWEDNNASHIQEMRTKEIICTSSPRATEDTGWSLIHICPLFDLAGGTSRVVSFHSTWGNGSASITKFTWSWPYLLELSKFSRQWNTKCAWLGLHRCIKEKWKWWKLHP